MITHFSKVGLRAVFFSYKNMYAIVITCSNSKLSQSVNQSINQSNLVFVKRRLNKVPRGASYE